MFASSVAAERERFERHSAVRRARLLCPPRLVSVAEDRAARRGERRADVASASLALADVPSQFASGVDLRAARSAGGGDPTLDPHAQPCPGTASAAPAPVPAPAPEAAREDGAEEDSETGADDPLVAALALVEAAIAQDPAGMVDAALSDRLITCGRLVDRVRVAQAVTAGPWQARGVHCGQARSAPCWLSMHTDIARGEARSVLQTAAVVRAHPVLEQMLRDSRLRFRHVEQLATVATSDRAELFARDVALLASTSRGRCRTKRTS